MPLWIITPAVSPSDPAWQGRSVWRYVIVRAPTPAFARLVASRETGELNDDAPGNESRADNSALTDEKMYRVAGYAGTEYEPDGPDAVLAKDVWT